MKTDRLISIEVVVDSETGVDGVGDLEYNVPSQRMGRFLAKPGNREKLADWLGHLSEACRKGEAPFR